MPSPSPQLPPSLLSLEPVPRLRERMKAELSAEFDFACPMRLSRAPGRLDVMGGIADYTGSLVCEATLDRAAAVALQERADRQVQVFSFNLYDEHQPFTFRIPLEALATCPAEVLHKEFNQPGRRWAGYLAGCLFMLHERGLVDLEDNDLKGLNLALYSTVPLGAGVSSSAAIEVATMMNLVDHFGLREGSRLEVHGSETGKAGPLSLSPEPRALSPLLVASMCQQVENRIVGAPCGIMDQVTALLGDEGTLLRLRCQPHDLLPSLSLPVGVRVVGINSAVRHSVGGGTYGKTRCAAFMGHGLILRAMHRMDPALQHDPMNGYLANLPPEDYQARFRALLPERMKGLDYLEQCGPTIDKATVVHPDHEYHVRQATDHHVFEARRVQEFVQLLERAAQLPAESRHRAEALSEAGQLMEQSHRSYSDNALLGAEECDLLVEMARGHGSAGLYGAKITGGGSGGTVAILCDISAEADSALKQIMAEYEQRTGRHAEAFLGGSTGAWEVGTVVV